MCHKLKKITAPLLIVCSFSALQLHAASEDFNVSFTTLGDLNIDRITGLSFGNQVFVKSGGVCSMDANTPSNADAVLGNAQAAANYGDLSGTGCVAGVGAGTPGVYEVSGLPGQDVQITVNGISGGTDFDFNPNSGCIVDYDGGAGNDTCTAFTVGTAVTRTLASAGDTNSGGTAPTAGRLRVIVGGQITIGGSDLTPAQLYTQQFTIDAIY